MYNRASLVVGIKGGNIYLPSVCQKNIVMLMKKGDYIDYIELKRLYNTKIDVFYETKHIINWLESNLLKINKY